MTVVPEEIIMEEILPRLSMKSMVRCRCVCKSWNSQFYNPDFLSHLNNHRSSIISQNPKKRREDDYLILSNYCKQQSSSSSSVNYLQLSILSRKKLSETRIIHNHVPYPLSLSMYDTHLVGSINGLLCIAFHVEGNHQFVLWNPTIRFSKKISVPKHLCMDSVCWFGKPHYPMFYGFGWDSVTNDYKLIAKPLDRVSPAGVYSCTTDCWSNINIVNYDQYAWSSLSGEPPCVIVNGSPYWNYRTRTRTRANVILKFDTSNNEFTYLKAPPSDICDSHNFSTLINLNDCLASIGYMRRDVSWWYLAIVYRFDEQQNMWMHMYTIDKCVINRWGKKVYSFKYGGEIMHLGTKHLYLYDPKSREIKCRRRYSNCGGCPVNSRTTKRRRSDHDCGYACLVVNVFSYNPSLVALPGMKALHL